MKSTKLSVIAAIAIMGIFSGVNAGDFDDAFKNGKVTGDVTVTYESRNQKKELGAYYSDTAYSVGSAELIYKTAAYHNFSLAYGLRGYRVLWEDDDKFNTGHGTGDASERFYNIDGGSTAVTTNAYLAYDTKNIHLKAGRQELNTEWVDEHHDAVSIYATPIEKLEVEFIWSKSHYRMWSRELFYGGNRSINTVNNGDGLFKLGLTYKITDSLKFKAYALNAPDYYSVYGGKITLDKKIGDISYGGFAHYMQTNEKTTEAMYGTNTDKDAGSLIDVKAYVGIDGYTAALGYIKTGEDAGWGSAVRGGENVDPFEEGDQLYVVDSRTTYATLSKTIAGLSLSAIYGITDYRNTKGGTQYSKSEACLWAGYDLTKKLNLSAIVTLNNADSDDTGHTDMTQISSTLTYKF
jgi:hypothetical protein